MVDSGPMVRAIAVWFAGEAGEKVMPGGGLTPGGPGDGEVKRVGQVLAGLGAGDVCWEAVGV